MHVALPTVMGEVVDVHEVEVAGIRSAVQVRRVGENYVIYVEDLIPERLRQAILKLDVQSIYESIVRRPNAKIEREVLKFVHRVLRDDIRKLRLSRDEVRELERLSVSVFKRWLYYYGSLTPLLTYPKLTDVYVRSDGVQAYHMDYGLCDVDLSFPSYRISTITFSFEKLVERKTVERRFSYEDLVMYVISRMCERCRTALTAYMPMASVTDVELRIRLSAQIQPISRPYCHIRVLPLRPWTLPRLIRRGMLTFDQAALLWYLFDEKVPIIVVGPMGSGKTSLANAVAFMSNPDRYKALVMDVDEMSLPGHNAVKLFERRAYGLGIKEISKHDLIAHALRLGVDYIIVNEVRTREETSAWINAVTTGHGGITTFHAEDLESTRIRLSALLPESDVDSLLKYVVVVEIDVRERIEYREGIRYTLKHRYVRRIHKPPKYVIPEDEIAVRQQFLQDVIDVEDDEILLSMLRDFYRRPEASKV